MKQNQFKYIALILLTFCTLIISACSNDGDNISSNDVNDINNQRAENYQTSQTNSFNNAALHGLNFDYERTNLLLTDYQTGKVIKSITFDNSCFTKDIFKLSKGYAVQLIDSDKPIITKLDYGYSIDISPEDNIRRTIQIYNEELILQKEIALSDILSKEFQNRFYCMAVSNDGNKIALANMEMELYVYDIPSGQLNKILDEKNNGIAFGQIYFSKDGSKLVFTGYKLGDEDNLWYGLIDLENNQMILNFEKGYRGGEINISDRYACLTDNVDPTDNSSSGKVLILDLQTNEIFPMRVEGKESAMATVTDDGRYLLALSKENKAYRIRQYRIRTGEIVSEKTFTPEDEGIVINILTAGESRTYYILLSSKNNPYFLYTFVCEDE